MTAPPRTRQSNFELLRITAMLLVLAVHADFLALGIPKADALAAQPLQTWTRIIIESLALVCVNTFVMISGWFGIRPTLRGAAALIFQCIFFAVLMHIADAAIFGKPISLDYIIKALTLQHAGWFVTAYLILYALSPVLNAFTEHTPARRVALVTLLLLAAEAVIGFWQMKHFERGYSPLSFIILYLLGHCLNAYKQPLRRICAVIKSPFMMYIVLCCANASVIAYCIATADTTGLDRATAYTNPLVIIAAAALVLTFAGITMRPCRAINFVAASAFAVFLLHMDHSSLGCIRFITIVRHTYAAIDGPLCIAAIAGVCIAVYAAAIVIDTPRKWLFAMIVRLARRLRRR